MHQHLTVFIVLFIRQAAVWAGPPPEQTFPNSSFEEFNVSGLVSPVVTERVRNFVTMAESRATWLDRARSAAARVVPVASRFHKSAEERGTADCQATRTALAGPMKILSELNVVKADSVTLVEESLKNSAGKCSDIKTALETVDAFIEEVNASIAKQTELLGQERAAIDKEMSPFLRTEAAKALRERIEARWKQHLTKTMIDHGFTDSLFHSAFRAQGGDFSKVPAFWQDAVQAEREKLESSALSAFDAQERRAYADDKTVRECNETIHKLHFEMVSAVVDIEMRTTGLHNLLSSAMANAMEDWKKSGNTAPTAQDSAFQEKTSKDFAKLRRDLEKSVDSYVDEIGQERAALFGAKSAFMDVVWMKTPTKANPSLEQYAMLACAGSAELDHTEGFWPRVKRFEKPGSRRVVCMATGLSDGTVVGSNALDGARMEPARGFNSPSMIFINEVDRFFKDGPEVALLHGCLLLDAQFQLPLMPYDLGLEIKKLSELEDPARTAIYEATSGVLRLSQPISAASSQTP